MTDWHKILVTVDDSIVSERVLNYVGEVVSCAADKVQILLLHVYPDPPPFYYTEGHNLTEYKEAKDQAARKIFDNAERILEKHHIAGKHITSSSVMTQGKTYSEVIIETRRQGEFGTVVLGRRGISKAEEFLFGSVSSAVIRESHDFTVWVVS